MKLFHYDEQSEIPSHVQIKEQVKVALALGKLQPGDPLPSIRSVEEELGIGRMLVRKAYRQLEQAGLVKITHGKGTIVANFVQSTNHRAQKADQLAQRFLSELKEANLEPVSFARLFHQRLLAEDNRLPHIHFVDSSASMAEELAQQVKSRLGLQVLPWSIDSLNSRKDKIEKDDVFLVNFYYLEDVRKLLPDSVRRVYPVALDYAPDFIDQLQNQPIRSRILMLFHQSTLHEEATQLAIQALTERFEERSFKFDVKAVEKAGKPETLMQSDYKVILVSNRAWDSYGDLFGRYPHRFWRLAVRVNRNSLDALREELGVVF